MQLELFTPALFPLIGLLLLTYTHWFPLLVAVPTLCFDSIAGGRREPDRKLAWAVSGILPRRMKALRADKRRADQ